MAHRRADNGPHPQAHNSPYARHIPDTSSFRDQRRGAMSISDSDECLYARSGRESLDSGSLSGQSTPGYETEESDGGTDWVSTIYSNHAVRHGVRSVPQSRGRHNGEGGRGIRAEDDRRDYFDERSRRRRCGSSHAHDSATTTGGRAPGVSNTGVDGEPIGRVGCGPPASPLSCLSPFPSSSERLASDGGDSVGEDSSGSQRASMAVRRGRLDNPHRASRATLEGRHHHADGRVHDCLPQETYGGVGGIMYSHVVRDHGRNNGRMLFGWGGHGFARQRRHDDRH